MFGWSRASVLGASVALAGGLAYLIWDHVSSFEEEEEEEEYETRRLGADGQSAGEEGEDNAAAAPLVDDKAQYAEKQSRRVVSGGARVLVLGLDGAGKTSLLHSLATGCLEQDTEPTQGFNAVSIDREDMYIEFLEIGGKEEFRPYWQKYMSTAQLLVFVVDSSNPQLFPIAKKHLHELLASDPCLPLMVLANKQDLPGACSITDLHDALSLSEVRDRRLFLFSTHVRSEEPSSGVQKARDLMIQMVCDSK